MFGIIGMGYVGTALKEGFNKHYEIATYDINSTLSSCNSINELVSQTKIIFLCVPTPMKKNGMCDIGIIENVIQEIDNSIDTRSNTIIVIKSTIPPGTVKRLNLKYQNFNIIFNPEFLTEANFIDDFKKQDRIILGGKVSACNTIKKFYFKCFPKANYLIIDSNEAEMVKYLANTFLATKVSFANEIKLICDKLEIDYNKVVECSIFDSRLGSSHWSVPGPDGKFGFGGSCFPKDINALIYTASILNIDAKVLKSVWATNLKVRPEKDWEKLKGRAISDNDE